MRAAIACALIAIALIAIASIPIAGCSGQPEPPPAAVPAAPADAGVVDGITSIGISEPGALDGDPRNPRISQQPRFKNRPPRPIDVVLKSSPTGAVAAVDGVQIGITPTYWYGESDGREHEFTFVLRGHAVGRYRFVPIQSGVVHARLEPVADEPLDGGLGPVMSPTFTPDPNLVVPPPPTVITPDAPAPVEPAPKGLGPTP